MTGTVLGWFLTDLPEVQVEVLEGLRPPKGLVRRTVAPSIYNDFYSEAVFVKKIIITGDILINASLEEYTSCSISVIGAAG